METRETILQAARQIYLRDGLQGLSMRKVAKDCGITATAIYRHFDNKESMLIEVVGQGSRLFLECLSRGLQGRTSLQRLELSAIGYLEFALVHQSYYRILFMSSNQDIGLAKLCEQAAQDFAPTFQFLVDRIRECMDDGVLAKADHETTALTIWAGCHGLVSLRLADQLPSLSDEQFRAVYQSSTGALLKGLA